jgi:hypothetical protein
MSTRLSVNDTATDISLLPAAPSGLLTSTVDSNRGEASSVVVSVIVALEIIQPKKKSGK